MADARLERHPLIHCAEHCPSTAPYDQEVSTALQSLGLNSTRTFSRANWAAPSGLFLFCVIVPTSAAPTGRSSDYGNGPIIINPTFPIYVDAELLLNGVAVDVNQPSAYQDITTLTDDVLLQGYSHMPLSFSENDAYIPGVPGAYEWHITVENRNRDGWVLRFPFDVTE